MNHRSQFVFIPLLLLLAMCCSGIVKAQSEPMPFWLKASTADRVVSGIIIKVEDQTVKLVVDQWIVGQAKDENDLFITVKKYQDGAKGKRWEPYAIGQKVLLFLKESGDQWEIMGEAGEGEHLIFQGQALIDNRGGGIWNDWQEMEVRGQKMTVEPVLLNELAAAIIDFRYCFRVEDQTAQGGEIKVRKLVDDKELKKKRFFSDVLDQMMFALLDWNEARKGNK